MTPSCKPASWARPAPWRASSHPHIVRIYNLGPAGEPPHFVMEYLEGAPLTRAAAALTFQQRAELMRKVVLAAEFPARTRESSIATSKPANILVGPDLEPKLLDFGLALDLEAQDAALANRRGGRHAGISFPGTGARAEQSGRAQRRLLPRRHPLRTAHRARRPFAATTTGVCCAASARKSRRCPAAATPPSPRISRISASRRWKKTRRTATHRRARWPTTSAATWRRRPCWPNRRAYSRLIAGQVSEHLRDLENWRRDQIVSDAEYDGIRKRYERLLEREDAWIMEVRRLTLPQVTLYLGAWILAVGAALLTFFPYRTLAGAPAVMVAWAAAVPMAWIGIRTWKRGYHRVAIAYLLAFAWCCRSPCWSPWRKPRSSTG